MTGPVFARPLWFDKPTTVPADFDGIEIKVLLAAAAATYALPLYAVAALCFGWWLP